MIVKNNYIITSDGELYHYGVKGMKWGVRRDARILANHERNKLVRRANDAYRTGKITAEKRKELKREANARKKKYLMDIEEAYAKTSSDKERQKLDKAVADKTLREVPNASLKRGMASVNVLFGVANAASIGSTAYALAAVNPAFAGAAVAAGAVGVAAEAGYRYVVQLGLDKTS